MRTAIRITAIAVALAGLGSATAAPARTVEAPYDFDVTDPGASAWFGANYGVFFGDVVVVDTLRKERSAEITLTDASADAVSAAAWQESGETLVFCSDSGRIPIVGGEQLFVQVIIDATPQEPGGCDTPTVPTTGTATVVLRRK